MRIEQWPLLGVKRSILFFAVCLTKGDVVFVLDTSTSVGAAGLLKEKEFVIKMLYEFDIGPDNVRVALITYNQFRTVEFNLETYSNRADVIAAVNALQNIAVGTNTHRGLAAARTEVFGTSSDRPNVQNIAVVITDGRSRLPDETAQEALALRATGARVFGIGVGNVDPSEISVIASDPDEEYAFQVDDFDALAAIKDAVMDATCSKAGFYSVKVSEYFFYLTFSVQIHFKGYEL